MSVSEMSNKLCTCTVHEKARFEYLLIHFHKLFYSIDAALIYKIYHCDLWSHFSRVCFPILMASPVWKQTVILQFRNTYQIGHKRAGILTNRGIVGGEEFTAIRHRGDYPIRMRRSLPRDRQCSNLQPTTLRAGRCQNM